MASHSSKNGDGFIEIARLIAGQNPPRWLAKHFQRWSSSVMLDGMVHAKQLGKAEARTRLQKLSKAGESADRELHDSVVATSLSADEYGPLPDNAGVDVVLDDVRRRADAASLRLDLLGTGLDERLENLSDSLKLIAREYYDPEMSEFLKAERRVGPLAPTVQLGAFLKEIRRQTSFPLRHTTLSRFTRERVVSGMQHSLLGTIDHAFLTVPAIVAMANAVLFLTGDVLQLRMAAMQTIQLAGRSS